MSNEFKYDIAFSLLDRDEALAQSIISLFEGRLRVFLYSEKQKELAGTDGEEKFHSVFQKEARIVAVLYRKEWGTTHWTKIEETAIRNRGFEEGYDFATFVMLDKGILPPKWFPKNRIWAGIEHLGIEGVAAVIESRVQEAGGELKEETVTERAARLDAEIKGEMEKSNFLSSDKGVKAACEEAKNLFAILKMLAEEISSTASNFKFVFDCDDRTAVIYGGKYTVVVNWHANYANTLDGSLLEVRLVKGAVSFKGRRFFDKPREIESVTYNFTLSKTGEYRWSEESSSNRLHSSKKLAEDCLTMLMQAIKKNEPDDIYYHEDRSEEEDSY